MESIFESRLVSSYNAPVNLVASKAVAVTPGADFISACNLYVGTGGDLEVVLPGDLDTAVIFKNVADGSFLPVLVVKVLADNTNASDILALY